MTISGIEALLRRARFFTSVEPGYMEDATSEGVFTAFLGPELEQEFLADVRTFLGGRERDLEDTEVEKVMTDLLLRRLRVDGEITVECGPGYYYDRDEPSMPDYVVLTVRLKWPKTSGKKRKKSAKTKSAVEKNSRSSKKAQARTPSGSSEEERRIVLQRGAERERSRRRRAGARTAKLLAGDEVRVGRVGYTRKVWDSALQQKVWAPTPGAEKVMREVDRVWGKSIHTGADLAAHLDSRGMKSLNGKRFTRNMMTALLRHLARLRRSGAFARHDEPTR